MTWLAGRSGNCCMACLLSCLWCIISYIEKFFQQLCFLVCRKLWLQLRDGESTIVNDDLTGNIFWLCDIIIGTVTVYIGVLYVI
ncbi:hypothetical protein KXD40_004775 [Peronospora effusa]|nr:hypothetical protein KXD40_004775 [Peronospora effusa]